MHTDLQQLTEEMLRRMGFVASARVLPPDEGEVVVVAIEAPHASLLIGKEGRNIVAIQHVLRLLARGVLLDSPRFIIDINDYRQQRKEFLRELAETVAQRVEQEDVVIELKPMNSFERRIIHVTLASRPGVITQSVGEGSERRVTIQQS